jgi:hypothetical protein
MVGPQGAAFSTVALWNVVVLAAIVHAKSLDCTAIGYREHATPLHAWLNIAGAFGDGAFGVSGLNGLPKLGYNQKQYAAIIFRLYGE